MSALHKSLDETLSAIRDEHSAETKALKDQLLAAKIEATMLTNRLAEALADRDKWMRIGTKLVTQFAAVENIFSDAKKLAISFAEEEAAKTSPPATEIPQ